MYTAKFVMNCIIFENWRLQIEIVSALGKVIENFRKMQEYFLFLTNIVKKLSKNIFENR